METVPGSENPVECVETEKRIRLQSKEKVLQQSTLTKNPLSGEKRTW